REVQIATDRIRNGLSFVVIVETGDIAPAGVAPQLNQSRPDHDPKSEPAEKPENKQWGPAAWEWPAIEEWTEKNREEPGFEELNFPAITVPDLANMDDRHVHHPKNRQNDCVGITSENDE